MAKFAESQGTDGALDKQFQMLLNSIILRTMSVYVTGITAAEPAQMVHMYTLQQWTAIEERKGSWA